ncbi:MAG: hypothetical protein WKF59_11050 [Chitinophagaceae bacterium]
MVILVFLLLRVQHLVISGIGITTQEVAVGTQTNINLSMIRSGTELTEVMVVTGVGTATSKRNLVLP